MTGSGLREEQTREETRPDQSASKDFDESLKKLRGDYQKVENESPQAFWPGVSEHVNELPINEITDFLSMTYKANGADRSIGQRREEQTPPIHLFLPENKYNLAVGWYVT